MPIVSSLSLRLTATESLNLVVIPPGGGSGGGLLRVVDCWVWDAGPHPGLLRHASKFISTPAENLFRGFGHFWFSFWGIWACGWVGRLVGRPLPKEGCGWVDKRLPWLPSDFMQTETHRFEGTHSATEPSASGISSVAHQGG